MSNLDFVNPNLSFNDKKNKIDISAKNTKINLDELTFKEGILDINKIDVSKDNLTLNDKESNFNLLSKEIGISVETHGLGHPNA